MGDVLHVPIPLRNQIRKMNKRIIAQLEYERELERWVDALFWLHKKGK